MSLKGTVFSPTSANSVGVVRSLTRYLLKLCMHNVTNVTNVTSARHSGYMCCVRVSKEPTKQGQPQAIFSFPDPACDK